MSLPLHHSAREPLVVLAGEEIVCPGCGETLLVFGEDVYGVEPLREAWKPALSGCPPLSGCRICGAAWGTHASPQHGPASEVAFPRIHLRSGSWTGWRALGGE